MKPLQPIETEVQPHSRSVYTLSLERLFYFCIIHRLVLPVMFSTKDIVSATSSLLSEVPSVMKRFIVLIHFHGSGVLEAIVCHVSALHSCLEKCISPCATVLKYILKEVMKFVEPKGLGFFLVKDLLETGSLECVKTSPLRHAFSLMLQSNWVSDLPASWKLQRSFWV